MSEQLFTANPHDDGYDLVPGRDVTNERVGRVYREDAGLDSGLVVALDDQSEDTVDTAAEAQEWLASHGYALDAESVRAIEAL